MAQLGILKIKKLIEALVDYAGANYTQLNTEGYPNESFILRCFDDDDNDEGISYKDTAISLFTRSELDSRKLEVRLLFDRDRASLPTIHVREPAKQKGNSDAIGYTDEELFLNEIRLDELEEPVYPRTYQEKVRRSFNSQFDIMITSANRHEVLIIEEVLVALLMASQDNLSQVLPFYNIQISVKELMFNGEITPNIFIKSISLNVNYDKVYPELPLNDLFSKIMFEHQLLTQ